MNAAAPQAPVAASSGKNKKPQGAGTPAALVKGLNKGSTAFQQLLNARAAQKTGRSVVSAAAAARAQAQAKAEAEAGLKFPLSILLARLAMSSAQKAGGANEAAHSSDAPAAPARIDPSRKNPARSAALTGAEALAGPHGGAHAAAPSGVKEQKDALTEPAKAPVIESKAAAHRSEPVIHVVDLRRREKAPSEAAAERRMDPAPSQDRDMPASAVTRSLSSETFPGPSARPALSSSTAATPLERLREMAGSELVRVSQLVLKDGGGEIRLVLKPESLGSVRVRMNVVDNSIEGRIIVDSAAVKHVLDGSVDALRRALTAEGFQMGSLQVSVGGQDAQADQRRQQEQAPSEVRRITAQGFDRNVPGVEDVSLGDLFVNLFV